MSRTWRKNPFGRERGIIQKLSAWQSDLLDELHLAHGSHSDPGEGVCMMEALAYITTQTHTDHPVCVSDVITQAGIGLNDAWGDETRQRLKEVLPDMVGTRPTQLTKTERTTIDPGGKEKTFHLWMEAPDSTPEYLEAEKKRASVLRDMDADNVDECIAKLKEACAISADGDRVEVPQGENPVCEVTRTIVVTELEEIVPEDRIAAVKQQ